MSPAGSRRLSRPRSHWMASVATMIPQAVTGTRNQWMSDEQTVPRTAITAQQRVVAMARLSAMKEALPRPSKRDWDLVRARSGDTGLGSRRPLSLPGAPYAIELLFAATASPLDFGRNSPALLRDGVR